LGLHQLEEVLALDELEYEVSALPLLDQVVNTRDYGDVRERTKDLGLTAEEVEADRELLLVGADHVLDGDLAIVRLRIGGKVDGTEAAHRDQSFDAVTAVQQRAGCRRQRGAAALAVALARRIGDATGRVGTEVRRSLHLGGTGGFALNQVAAVHAGDGAGVQVGATGGTLCRRRCPGRRRRCSWRGWSRGRPRRRWGPRHG